MKQKRYWLGVWYGFFIAFFTTAIITIIAIFLNHDQFDLSLSFSRVTGTTLFLMYYYWFYCLPAWIIGGFAGFLFVKFKNRNK